MACLFTVRDVCLFFSTSTILKHLQPSSSKATECKHTIPFPSSCRHLMGVPTPDSTPKLGNDLD